MKYVIKLFDANSNLMGYYVRADLRPGQVNVITTKIRSNAFEFESKEMANYCLSKILPSLTNVKFAHIV